MTEALGPVVEILEAGRREGLAPGLAAVVLRGGLLAQMAKLIRPSMGGDPVPPSAARLGRSLWRDPGRLLEGHPATVRARRRPRGSSPEARSPKA